MSETAQFREDVEDLLRESTKEVRGSTLRAAIQRHKDQCDRYQISRGVDRELWEVLGND